MKHRVDIFGPIRFYNFLWLRSDIIKKIVQLLQFSQRLSNEYTRFSINHTKKTINVKSRDLGDGQSTEPPIPIRLIGKCL